MKDILLLRLTLTLSTSCKSLQIFVGLHASYMSLITNRAFRILSTIAHWPITVEAYQTIMAHVTLGLTERLLVSKSRAEPTGGLQLYMCLSLSVPINYCTNTLYNRSMICIVHSSISCQLRALGAGGEVAYVYMYRLYAMIIDK